MVHASDYKGGSDSRANSEALLDLFEGDEEGLREYCEKRTEFYNNSHRVPIDWKPSNIHGKTEQELRDEQEMHKTEMKIAYGIIGASLIGMGVMYKLYGLPELIQNLVDKF